MITMTVGDVFTGLALIIVFITVVVIIDTILQEWDEADNEDFKDD